jgi:transcriptional regulator with XRE-family HTH domain
VYEDNSFGIKLKKAREREAWTQVALANELGVARGTVNRWEKNVQRPSAYYLDKITAILELNEQELDAPHQTAQHKPPEIENFLSVPFPSNPLFTGRDSYFEQLDKHFKVGKSVALTQPVSISGLGGIGKTQLALEYAHRCYKENVYRAVFWVNAADETALERSYANLAETLRLPERDEQRLDLRVDAVKRWLKDHTNWLLIMDNADDLELARSFFPSTHQGHILLTTRSQSVGEIGAMQIEIDRMKKEEGLVFLLRRSGKLQVDAPLDTVAVAIRETALDLVELLDGHPLALDQAGAFIDDTKVSFAEYVDLYRAKRSELLNMRRALDDKNESKYNYHPDTVVVTFKLCIGKAGERHPLATDILHFCAFLQPDLIAVELFLYDDSIKHDTLAFKKGIAALLRYSLIKPHNQENICSIHRLVQAVLIDSMLPDTQKQWRARVVHSLIAAIPVEFNPDRVLNLDADDIGAELDRVSLPSLLMLQVEDICSTWKGDDLPPMVDLSVLFYTAAKCLVNNADCSEYTSFWTGLPSYSVFGYKRAAELYRLAFKISEKKLGAMHPDTQKYKEECMDFLRKRRHIDGVAALETKLYRQFNN